MMPYRLIRRLLRPQGTTPFRLVHGKHCHLLVKLEHKAHWAVRTLNFDLKSVGEKRLLDLNEIDEIRLDAYESTVLYKKKTKNGTITHY